MFNAALDSTVSETAEMKTTMQSRSLKEKKSDWHQNPHQTNARVDAIFLMTYLATGLKNIVFIVFSFVSEFFGQLMGLLEFRYFCCIQSCSIKNKACLSKTHEVKIYNYNNCNNGF